MEFGELFLCKHCSESFHPTLRKPLILKCGHTFCENCLKTLFDSEKIICPLDAKASYFDDFQQISTNFLILEASEEAQKQKFAPEKTCQLHKTQIIRFFCQTHKSLLCQECLILHHLGPNHEIIPSENIVLIEPLKKSIEKILKNVKEDKEKMDFKLKESSNEFKKIENELQNMKKNIVQTIEKNYNELMGKKQKEMEVETQRYSKFADKIASLQEKTGEIEEFLKKLPSNLAYVTNSDPPLLETLKKYETFLLENNETGLVLPQTKASFVFTEPPLLSKEDMNELIRVQIPTYDKKNRRMLALLREEGVLKSELVHEIMLVINRRNFVPENMITRAYQDNPLAIGWNTTISAPHMHAQTLEELKGHLKKGGKAIDIGCGSGYMTACMAEIMGENGKVFGIDHIEEIVNFAKNNIVKKNSYLLESKRVELVKMDGRKGFADEAPFDVIHVGGSIQAVPPELLNQLAKGGRMWIPVGPSGCQAIYLYDKDLEGKVKSTKLFNVSYGLLTNVEDQLQHF